MTSNSDFTILDPTDERVPVRRKLAPRPTVLAGTIGLLDITKPRGDVLIERIEKRLGERYPELTFVRYRKPTFTSRLP